MNGRRVLITGATGFVGSNLAKALLKSQNSVSAVIRSSSDVSLYNLEGTGILFHEYSGGVEKLREIVRSARPEIVYHLASNFVAEHDHDQVMPLVRDNVLFGAELLEAVVLESNAKFVNTSTSWVHYQGEDYNPVCFYAATKKAFSDIAKFYVKSEGLCVSTLELFDTYGANDQRRKLFSMLVSAAFKNEVLRMSPGEQLIDLVHIDDVVRAYVLLGESMISSSQEFCDDNVFSISSSNPISLHALVDRFGEALGKTISVNWGGRPYRKREVMNPWDRGLPLPGWRPLVPLDTGLRELANSLILKFEGNHI